jgi:hypothetical protein
VKGILLLFGAASVAFAQPFSFGFKVGVPMTDVVSATSNLQGAVSASTNRYVIGPQAELHLPFGFAVEFDILYRHFNYSAIDAFRFRIIQASANSWDFPLLAKKYLTPGPLRPFVDAGVTFNKLTGLSQTIRSLAGASATQNDSLRGFTIGGGADAHLLKLHIAPELRYTRWGSQVLNFVLPGGTLTSGQNQAEFLVGISF